MSTVPKDQKPAIVELDSAELAAKITFPTDSVTLGQIRKSEKGNAMLMNEGPLGENLDSKLATEKDLAYLMYQKALHGSNHRADMDRKDTVGNLLREYASEVAGFYVDMKMASGESSAKELILGIERQVHALVKEVHGMDPNPR